MSYQYDIFVSYKRGGEAGEWVRNHFEPRLRGWLEQTMLDEPRIFWDRNIETGQAWPNALRVALSRSRFLVPVLSYPYIRSPWCLAELNTMIAREQALNLRSEDNLDGLIFPVCFHGDDFPEPIPTLQYRDMSKWAYPDPGFRETPLYMEFIDEIRAFATDLAARLPGAPDWEQGWPERIPAPAPLTEVRVRELAVPRL